MLPTSERARWAVVVLAATIVLMVLNAWWVMTFRDGYPFDIDEAGYTTFGLVHFVALETGGLDGWWDAIQAQTRFPPLVPAIASLLVYVKPGLMAGFAVLTAFLLVLAMAIYGIGERLAGPRLGALAALLTVTLPGTFAFSREYIFALPVAAFFACAVYALLRSDGLLNRRWAIICGAAIGLMLLSRSMAIVYVPGVLAAGLLLMVVRRQADLQRRFVNLALMVAAGVAVAATWYARNLQSVVDYLTEYGYGSKSEVYGDEEKLISWGRFRSIFERMTGEDLYLPLAILLLLGIGAVAFVAARKAWGSTDRPAALKRLIASDATAVALVFLAGYAALMTSQNGGNGFTYPLAILLPLLAVLALRRFQALQPLVISICAVITAANVLAMSTVWAEASRTRLVSLPGFDESLPVLKGVPKAVFVIRGQVRGPEATFTARDAGWLRADRALVRKLEGLAGPRGEFPVAALASRHRVLNTNTLQLASMAENRHGLPLIQLEAEPTDAVATYREQLSDGALGAPSVLVTMDRNTDDFDPLVTQAYAEAAARRLGFRRIDTMRLPDGRQLRIWQRRGTHQ